MFSAIKGLFSSALTKYMLIAIAVLVAALGSAVWLSYKFYGEKQVAERDNQILQDTVEQEREQVEKAKESARIVDEAVQNVRQDEKDLTEASEKLIDEVHKQPPTDPQGDTKDAAETTREPSMGVPEGIPEGESSDNTTCLTDNDVRLLQSAHCLSDGDTSDCDF